MIIMSAHHRSRLDSALLGSNSARVVERAQCSVMILRGDALKPA
jgi:nucleotide-binding universal stress UspA family protein